MMKMTPIELDGRTVIGIEVLLPKTTLLAVATDKGYIMCGADNVRGFISLYKSSLQMPCI